MLAPRRKKDARARKRELAWERIVVVGGLGRVNREGATRTLKQGSRAGNRPESQTVDLLGGFLLVTWSSSRTPKRPRNQSVCHSICRVFSSPPAALRNP